MKSSFSKFLLFSLMVISSLGAVKGDRTFEKTQTIETFQVGELQVESLIQKGIEAQSKRQRNSDNKDEGKFAFKFPNIFSIFRSLF